MRNFAREHKDSLFKWLRILVSGILLIVLFSRVRFAEVMKVIGSFSPVLLMYIPFAFFANLFFSVYKWQAILNNFGLRIKLAHLSALYLIGIYFSNFLPSTIGGDSYRFVKLRSEHPGNGEIIVSSIMLERGYGFLMTVLLQFLMAAVYWRVIAASPLLIIAEAGMLIGLIGLVFFWKQRNRFGRLLSRFDRWNIVEKMLKALSLFKEQSLKTVLVSILASTLFLLTSGVALLLYYRMVGIQVPLSFVLLVSTLSALAGALPISLNGLGLVELVQVLLMSSQGASNEAVLIVSLTGRAMTALLSATGGLLYLSQTVLPASFLRRKT